MQRKTEKIIELCKFLCYDNIIKQFDKLEFSNNNILVITVISGIFIVLIQYLIFKVNKKQVRKEWKLNKLIIKDVVIAFIIVSSVLFGVMHFAAGGIVLIIGAIIMALAFGYIFYKFESLLVCIIAHVVANLPEFIIDNNPSISGNMFLELIIFFCVYFL